MPALVALAPLFGQLIDLLVTTLTKDPATAPHLGPVLVTVMGALSQASGETAAQTQARRTAAEAIFVKQAGVIG